MPLRLTKEVRSSGSQEIETQGKIAALYTRKQPSQQKMPICFKNRTAPISV